MLQLMQVKQCSRCNEVKSVNEFYINRNSLRRDCKRCNNNQNCKARKKRLANSSLEEYLVYTASRSYHSRRSNGVLWGFNLTLDDIRNQLIKQDYKCYWTNVELKLDVETYRKPSVDRLDNTNGYTAHNIVITIWAVNRMRGNLDVNDFRLLIDEIMTSKKTVL
jgi:hypothetical protein